jgi:hypothetical protein
MSINSLIINALNPFGVPVRFQKLTEEDGSPDTYITFFLINEYGSMFADNEEQQTASLVQVDIWSKSNYNSLVEQVKNKLKEIGFTRTAGADLYEEDTKIYHKAMRFVYIDGQD